MTSEMGDDPRLQITPHHEGINPITPQDSVTMIRPEPDYAAQLTELRRRDLESVSDRLGCMSKFQWDRFWGAGTLLLFGGAIGGVFGILSIPRPDAHQ